MSEQINVPGPMYRPSRDDSRGIDAGTMRLLYLAGFGGVAILVGVAVFSLTGHSHGDAVPIVQADQRPIRVKPENPGGMTVTPEEKPVDFSDSHLAPPTEEPNPRALMALADPSKAARPAVVAAPRARPVTVQLSSAKSEAQAQADWNKLAKRMPELLAEHRALFQKVNEPGPSPWRLRTGGFADPAQAKAFCDKVKSKGGQCAVVES
jgi:cell division septation protein DedD